MLWASSHSRLTQIIPRDEAQTDLPLGAANQYGGPRATSWSPMLQGPGPQHHRPGGLPGHERRRPQVHRMPGGRFQSQAGGKISAGSPGPPARWRRLPTRCGPGVLGVCCPPDGWSWARAASSPGAAKLAFVPGSLLLAEQERCVRCWGSSLRHQGSQTPPSVESRMTSYVWHLQI